MSYDDWKTHNRDDERCEFCGAVPWECRGGWQPASMCRCHIPLHKMMEVRIERLTAALDELYATVKGECPSLLNEDSGGNDRLDLEIHGLLSHAATIPADTHAMREALTGLVKTANILQQNAEGCAVNHHGLDFEQQGLPGWLRDTKAEIDRAYSALAATGPSCRG